MQIVIKIILGYFACNRKQIEKIDLQVFKINCYKVCCHDFVHQKAIVQTEQSSYQFTGGNVWKV